MNIVIKHIYNYLKNMISLYYIKIIIKFIYYNSYNNLFQYNTKF